MILFIGKSINMARIRCIWRADLDGYNLYDLDGTWLTLFLPFTFKQGDAELGQEEPCDWDDEDAYRWDDGIEYVTYRE